jgi:hypothetical protein
MAGPKDKTTHTVSEAADGTLFVVLESGADWEHRGRRFGDRIHVETWRRIEAVDLSPESIAALHRLAEERLPRRSGR